MRLRHLQRDRPPGAPHGRRLINYPRRGARGPRRWLPSWRLTLGSVLLGAGCLVGLFVCLYVGTAVPDENADVRQEANVYYWADGSQMAATGAVDRQPVPLKQIPVSMRNAVIAAENATFYTDSGVSAEGMLRAAYNIAKGEGVQGGSTITQQYVKNAYLTQQQTAGRKVKELFIALKLGRQKSKNQILQGYLNTSWFGRGATGIEAAANAYYGIPAKDLDPSQTAVLAATLKGAQQYDPALSAANHRRSVQRWKWILDREVQVGLMTPGERAHYRTYPEPKPESLPNSMAGQTGYLVTLADNYITKVSGLSTSDLSRGGYRIYTTFEKDKVAKLRRAVEQVTDKDLDPKKRAADRDVQIGAASVRPRDGAVVAVYGGADATTHFTDNADTVGVAAGSAFKPFTLAAYFEQQKPAAVAQNAGHSVFSLPNIANDLVNCDQAPFELLGRIAGLPSVEKTALDAGLLKSSMAPLEQTFPIGTSTPSAIRLAAAYGEFTEAGIHHEPYSVSRVVRDGTPLHGFGPVAPRRALSTRAARTVNLALQDLASLTGTKTVAPGVGSIATGANDTFKSDWFIGYDTNLSTSVTLFREKPGGAQLLPLSGVGGKNTVRGNTLPPRIWATYMGKPGDFTLKQDTFPAPSLAEPAFGG